MNRVIIVLLCGIGLTMSAWTYAWDGDKHGPDHGQALMMKMWQQLDLSDAQKEQAKAIHEEMKSLRAQHHGMEGAAAMMALNPMDKNYHAEVEKLAHEFAQQIEKNAIARAEARAKLYSILEPQQRDKLAAMEKKMMERRKARFERHGEDF